MDLRNVTNSKFEVVRPTKTDSLSRTSLILGDRYKKISASKAQWGVNISISLRRRLVNCHLPNHIQRRHISLEKKQSSFKKKCQFANCVRVARFYGGVLKRPLWKFPELLGDKTTKPAGHPLLKKRPSISVLVSVRNELGEKFGVLRYVSCLLWRNFHVICAYTMPTYRVMIPFLVPTPQSCTFKYPIINSISQLLSSKLTCAISSDVLMVP